jgi:hypothetical protein
VTWHPNVPPLVVVPYRFPDESRTTLAVEPRPAAFTQILWQSHLRPVRLGQQPSSRTSSRRIQNHARSGIGSICAASETVHNPLVARRVYLYTTPQFAAPPCPVVPYSSPPGLRGLLSRGIQLENHSPHTRISRDAVEVALCIRNQAWVASLVQGIRNRSKKIRNQIERCAPWESPLTRVTPPTKTVPSSVKAKPVVRSGIAGTQYPTRTERELFDAWLRKPADHPLMWLKSKLKELFGDVE